MVQRGAVLQRVAVCYSVVQRGASCCSVLQRVVLALLLLLGAVVPCGAA